MTPYTVSRAVDTDSSVQACSSTIQHQRHPFHVLEGGMSIVVELHAFATITNVNPAYLLFK